MFDSAVFEALAVPAEDAASELATVDQLAEALRSLRAVASRDGHRPHALGREVIAASLALGELAPPQPLHASPHPPTPMASEV